MRYNLNCVNIDYMSSNFAKWLNDNGYKCYKWIDTPLQSSEQVFYNLAGKKNATSLVWHMNCQKIDKLLKNYYTN